jgi:hypothetical protein
MVGQDYIQGSKPYRAQPILNNELAQNRKKLSENSLMPACWRSRQNHISIQKLVTLAFWRSHVVVNGELDPGLGHAITSLS